MWRGLAFAGLLLWGISYIVVFAWLINNSRDFVVEARRNALCPPAACTLQSLPISARFEANSDDTRFLLSGFSRPEESGTWTVEHQAEIYLPVDLRGTDEIEVRLDFAVALSEQQPSQRLRVSDGRGNWLDVALLQLPSPPESASFNLPVSDHSQPGLRLRIELPDAWIPAKLGLSGDTRLLGIFLKSLRIRDSAALPPRPAEEATDASIAETVN